MTFIVSVKEIKDIKRKKLRKIEKSLPNFLFLNIKKIEAQAKKQFSDKKSCNFFMMEVVPLNSIIISKMMN